MTELRPRQENLRLVFSLFKSMLGKPRIRLNNLKTIMRFPCLGLNSIIDSISHTNCPNFFENDGKNIRVQKNYLFIYIFGRGGTG